MNIILGYWLDSSTYPDALLDQEASVGNVVTGFKGLIGILETQLGLTTPIASENIRIAEWQELIRLQDTGDKPFSKSYETDSWNTAKELLRRRDELVMAGWNPTIQVDGSIWIHTLAQLELSNQEKTRGFSDRVWELIAKLQENVQLNIDTITVVDEDETLWDPWYIQLINILKSKGVQVVKRKTLFEKKEKQTPLSDLSLLQSVMAGDKLAEEAKGDGSLLLIRAEQEWDAIDFLVSLLQQNDKEDTVLIKGEGSLLLDELLHRRGLPAAGVDVSSKWRAVLQVLPLTIDTYWKPVRVERMMELLTIPGSPVPGKIRFKLAKVLTSNPGIDGPQWKQKIEDGVREYTESWLADGLDEHEIKKRQKELDAKLDLWVRHDYYDQHEGIPYEKLVHICQKVSQWAATKYHMTNDLMYTKATQCANEVIEGLKTLGVKNVSHLQVARIIDSVIGEGSKLINYKEEASNWQVVKNPGEIWGNVDTILWWGFHKNGLGPSIRTWTTKERELLMKHGVNLLDEDIKRRREAVSWQRAVRLANKKLIMFAPTKVKGEEIPIHPLWDEIRYCLAKENNTEKKLIIHAANLRKNRSYEYFGDGHKRVLLKSSNIPEPIRTWKVPPDIVLPRSEESATSFEGLIGCPLKWTFTYAAGVRPGNIMSLPNESLMLGNLGHVVLEKLITEKTSWTEDEVRIRVGEVFDELTPMIAAPLLEPQNSILRNETRFNLQKSLQQFFKVLNHTSIQIKETELSMQKTWNDSVEFKGRLDLVGETTTGNKILFDAKWSRKPVNYKKRLENISVQLTLYHWLLADHENEELPVAYFMLRSGDFFSLPHADFPSDYHVLGPSLLESHQILRNSVEDVWSQLKKGTVIAPGVPPKEEDSVEPFETTIDPPCKFCDYQNLCGFRRIT